MIQSIEASTRPPAARRLLRTVRELGGDLGVRDTWLGVLVVLTGLVGIAASLLMIASPAQLPAFQAFQAGARRVFALDHATEVMLQVLSSHSGESLEPSDWERAQQALRGFDSALRDTCQDLGELLLEGGAHLNNLRGACGSSAPIRARLANLLTRFQPGDRAQQRILAGRELMLVYEDVHRLRDWYHARWENFVEALAAEDREVRRTLVTADVALGLLVLSLPLLLGRSAWRHVAKARQMTAVAGEPARSAMTISELRGCIPVAFTVIDQDGSSVLAHSTAARTTSDRVGEPQLVRMADGRSVERSTWRMPSGRTVEVEIDVSRHLEHASELRRSQALVDSLSDTLFAIDADGRFIYASPPVLTLLGISPESIVGHRFFEFIHPDDMTLAEEHARAFIHSNDEDVRQRALRMVTVDGIVRHIEARFRKPIGADHFNAVAVGVLRDVTLKESMTKRLRDERLRLRSIIDSSGALILVVDHDRNVQLSNRGIEQFRAPDGASDESAASVVTAGLDGAILARWRVGPLTGVDARPVRFSCTLIDSEGVDHVFAVTAKPVVGPDGRLRQIVFLGVDDSERLQAEKALFDADRLATLGEMAATIVHELRQPLQVIMLSSEAAMDEPDDKEFVVEKLRRIESQVDRANRIIEDLRIFARGTSGEAPRPFDVATAVRNAISLTKASTRTASMGVEPILEENLPPILGHAPKLEQVLINLINNARDAGAHRLMISAAMRDTADAPVIELAVEDDGPGIPPAVLARLFKSFVTTKPSGKGTGLGLRICNRIVEEMGGKISVANRPEGGARFTILVPTTVEQANQKPDQ